MLVLQIWSSSSHSGMNRIIFISGSGKSYTMMGAADNKGLIPRLCDTLFERIAINSSFQTSHKVEVSYMEIYNEKVCHHDTEKRILIWCSCCALKSCKVLLAGIYCVNN